MVASSRTHNEALIEDEVLVGVALVQGDSQSCSVGEASPGKRHILHALPNNIGRSKWLFTRSTGVGI